MSNPPFLQLAGPVHLASSPSLQLLTFREQSLCSKLRMLPRPYLALKETIIREYARRGGHFTRREACELLRLDAKKTGQVWDFLHGIGYLEWKPPGEEREKDIAPSNAQTPFVLSLHPPMSLSYLNSDFFT